MKKVLAVLLAVICAFSAFSVSALELDEFGNIIGDYIGMTTEKDEAAALSYGVYYEMAMLSTVTLIYKPSPSMTFEAPTTVVITSDTPVAVDHDWVCWKDEKTGELYYPGDTIYVDGKVTLVAVWEEKQDNYPSFIRSAIAGIQAFVKLIEKFLGVFTAINDTKTTEPTETTEVINTTVVA